MKFRQGYTYKFEFIAYASEEDYNQEPYDAPGSAAIGTDTISFVGTLPAYVYATATLNDIKPAYGSIIESETDNVVTLTFSEPVKVVYAQNLQSAGMMMPPTVNELTPEAVEADENGLATVWTVVMPLTPGFANISFAAEDAEGRRVWGNQGEEETSYFAYEWQCTVGIPDFAVAPAGNVDGPVKTLTVTCTETIDPYMVSIVVLNAAGEEVATVENAEKIVDESLEMYTPEWYEAFATAPVTLTLSNEISEAGTYTVKFDAGAFMIADKYQSKATEVTFTIGGGDPNCVKTYNIEIADVKVADWAAEVLVDAATINEIATLLGATPADLTYQLVDTTGVRTDYNGNPGEILFWVDLDGNKSNWGVNNKFYVLYDAAVPQITAIQYGAAEGDVLNVTVRLANAEGKYVEIVVTETIYKSPVTTPADYEIVKEYDVVFDYNVASGEVTATFPDTEIAELLGVESFTFNEILTTDAEGNIVFTHTATTGYWMTAEGTPCKWGTADMCYFIEYREFGSGTF
ncbi:MAG: hypothetical protein IJY78_08470 [Bacteroidaceae bacterium]|nr:hypothetical protein [Bacteroidaceae bacterium]